MKKIISIIIAIIVIIIVFILAINFNIIPKKSYGEYDDFVICLKGSKVKFYGDYANTDSLRQMNLFGKSFQMLIDINIYIECNRYGYNPQIEKCREAGINRYPTWIIKDKKYVEAMSLGKLSELTGCKYEN